MPAQFRGDHRYRVAVLSGAGIKHAGRRIAGDRLGRADRATPGRPARVYRRVPDAGEFYPKCGREG